MTNGMSLYPLPIAADGNSSLRNAWQFRLQDGDYYCDLEVQINLDRIVQENNDQISLRFTMKVLDIYDYIDETPMTWKTQYSCVKQWATLGFFQPQSYKELKVEHIYLPDFRFFLHAHIDPLAEYGNDPEQLPETMDIPKHDVNRFYDHEDGNGGFIYNVSSTSQSVDNIESIIYSAVGFIPNGGDVIDLIGLILQIADAACPSMPSTNELPTLYDVIQEEGNADSFGSKIAINGLNVVLRAPGDKIEMAFVLIPGRCRTNRNREDSIHIEMRLPLVMFEQSTPDNLIFLHKKWFEVALSLPEAPRTPDVDFDVEVTDPEDSFKITITPCWPEIDSITDSSGHPVQGALTPGVRYVIDGNNFITGRYDGATSTRVVLGDSSDFSQAHLVEQEIVEDDLSTSYQTVSILLHVDESGGRPEDSRYWLYVVNDLGHHSPAFPVRIVAGELQDAEIETQPEPEPEAEPEPEPAETIEYIGNRNSRELHMKSCWCVRLMSESNKVIFTSIDTAIDQHYNGCFFCLRDYDSG